MADIPIQLPDGTIIDGGKVVVIVGPNGSGKSQLSRRLQSPGHSIEIVSASRSTRVSAQLPAMSQVQARAQHDGQRNQAKSQPWELVSDFDFVLAQLLAEDGDSARAFRAASKAGRPTASIEQTALEKVDQIWQEVFEGRTLGWEDWAPTVTNDKSQVPVYTANQMSDGERAALYLTAKTMLAAPGTVLIIDEPETHFHSALAILLWKSLQKHRDDLRFVFVTHDLTFATAQGDAEFLLAKAPTGFEVLPIDASLPSNLKRDILGAASFSYYASRVVFCEGTPDSLDNQFFSAWFRGRDTVVSPVGSCDAVRECVHVMQNGALVDNLNSIGLIDRDFRPDIFFQRMDSGLSALPIHEIEGVICLPGVVKALADHLGRDLPGELIDIVRNGIDDDVILRVAFERWKTVMLNDLQDRITAKPARPLNEASLRTHAEASLVVSREMSMTTFDQELLTVQSSAASRDVEALLATFPCKPIAAAVASALKESVSGLFELISRAIAAQAESPLAPLGQVLEEALKILDLPDREVAPRP